ncbi:MAG TPA: response regulator, partial [Thermoanaerobaculia bacterium]|nr:response regulator [Thermoanaerobaculia bacterium]
MTGRKPLNVLVVDDSAVVRQLLSAILSQQGMTVTVAADPLFAIRKMEQSRPDVVILDIEMPRMDGLTFLRKIMREAPLPVVICSSHASRGTETAMKALEEGAVDILPKPRVGLKEYLEESATFL